jgi:ribosomal-protein-alanine N-acetyltransferase
MEKSAASLTFERATEKDVETYIDLERKVENARLYGSALEVEKALDEIRKNSLYFVKRNGTIVGMVAGRLEPDGSIYISNVNTDPNYHRQGIARAAMEFILAKYETARRIHLVTHPENENALGLYQSLGFTIESRKENYFGDGEPRVVLALNRA